MLLFVFPTAWHWFRRGMKGPRTLYAISLLVAPALFLLALLSKEPAVALVPVVAVALAYHAGAAPAAPKK